MTFVKYFMVDYIFNVIFIFLILRTNKNNNQLKDVTLHN